MEQSFLKKYIHKPVVIEAVQLTPDNIEAVADWCGGIVKTGTYSKTPKEYWKLEYVNRGICIANMSDWIIHSMHDPYDFYHVTKDIFDITYQPFVNEE